MKPEAPATMRAVLHDQYGPPDLLRVGEIERPTPGPGEVLVQARAAGVHADVWHMIRGVPYLLRGMGGGLRRPKVPIPGTDVAGLVVAAGPGAGRFSPGDRVFGEVIHGIQWKNGATFAEYVVCPETRLELIPAHVSFSEAGAIPTSSLIAFTAVRTYVQVRAGERVLVNGAAGGVGQTAAQLARAEGAHVTGVERTNRVDLLATIGVDDVIDGERTDYTAGPATYDVVIDIPGNRPYSSVRRILGERGRYVLIGHDRYGAAGHRVLGSVPRALGFMARSLVDPHLLRPDFAALPADAWPYVVGLVASGAIHPLVEQTFPLDRAADALAHLESGQARGKVVLTIPE